MRTDLERIPGPSGAPDPVVARLRKLPAEICPPYGFEEFRRRAEQRRARRMHATGGRYVALAAGLAAAVAGIALWIRLGQEGTPDPAWTVPPVPGTVPFDRPTIAQGTDDAEQWLASLPDEPAVVRVGTRLAVTDLEDRIAWMDDLLTAERVYGAPPARVQALQRERARLVDSLARVRYAETLAAGLP